AGLFPLVVGLLGALCALVVRKGWPPLWHGLLTAARVARSGDRATTRGLLTAARCGTVRRPCHNGGAARCGTVSRPCRDGGELRSALRPGLPTVPQRGRPSVRAGGTVRRPCHNEGSPDRRAGGTVRRPCHNEVPQRGARSVSAGAASSRADASGSEKI